MEQLAPHEKVFVNKRWLTEDPVHSSVGCVQCHGGDPTDADWRTAHNTVSKDPSWDNLTGSCGMCHSDIATKFATSLHATLQPYVLTIEMRSSREIRGARRGQESSQTLQKVDAARESHCMSCHSSCGQCHVSRPESVEGGLLASHAIVKRPPMQETCAACHGSRVDREFFGKNEGMSADVHRQKYMKCGDCHSGDEMHGDGKEYENRYAVENRARCASCHESIYTEQNASLTQHVIHRDSVSCQVCHSMPYKNCYSCHVGKDDNGLNYFKTEPSVMGFKIGLNPLKSADRPEDFVTVRHVPIDHGLFDFYVEDGLANFDSLPTWKMATPHTISRKTPQNESCDSCHGNREIFLQESDVRPAYLNANRNVIVPDERIPPAMGN